MLSGDTSTLKRKPQLEAKVKLEPVEPVLKKIKVEEMSTTTSSHVAEDPSLSDLKKAKKKKKAERKSYLDDL
jgi:hypothetical protein